MEQINKNAHIRMASSQSNYTPGFVNGMQFRGD
jgi:hypothetical protein